MKRYLPHIALGLIIAQLLLMLISWLLSAAQPDSAVRSLLSGEGLRWLLGGYGRLLSTPVLVWLLLLFMAAGCVLRSRLLLPRTTYRQHHALMASLLVTLLWLSVVALLVLVPHAVLLSATGCLWPSPFSAGLVPLLALMLTSTAAVYGLVSGSFSGWQAVYQSLVDGLRQSAPLLLFYLLCGQLCRSVWFVFFHA